jgi:hypothetical protein
MVEMLLGHEDPLDQQASGALQRRRMHRATSALQGLDLLGTALWLMDHSRRKIPRGSV